MRRGRVSATRNGEADLPGNIRKYFGFKKRYYFQTSIAEISVCFGSQAGHTS